MTEGALEIVVILHIHGDLATVRLPDTSEEDWNLTVLPPGVEVSDQIGIEVEGGDWTMTLLPRPAGLRA